MYNSWDIPVLQLQWAKWLGVAKTAVCEKLLIDLLSPLEKSHRDLALQRDGPSELVLPPTVRPEKMTDIAASMEEAVTAPGTAEERQVVSLPRTVDVDS